MTLADLNPYGLWLTLPLALLSVGFGTAEAVILNRRLRTRPRGKELRWACSALAALGMLAPWIHAPTAFFFIASASIGVSLIAISRLRAEWRDRSREFFA